MVTTSLQGNFRFRAVYDGGRSAAGKYFVLFALKNSLEANRLGITVTKKIGCAVVRNRARRVIREGFRLCEHFAQGYDFVVLARPSIVGVGMNDIIPELTKLAKRLNLGT